MRVEMMNNKHEIGALPAQISNRPLQSRKDKGEMHIGGSGSIAQIDR